MKMISRVPTLVLVVLVDTCYGFSSPVKTRIQSPLVSISNSIQSPPKASLPSHFGIQQPPLYMVENDKDEKEPEEVGSTDEEDSLNKKIFGRQDRLQIGYQATCLIYASVAILHLFRRGINLWSLYYAVAGPLLVSGCAYILKGAATQDRLGSDTYKRLNLSLLLYGVLGLSLPIVDRAHFMSPSFIVPPIFATVNAIKGYGYGVLGWDKKKHVCYIFPDLGEGFQSTVKGLVNFPKESFDYLLMIIMVGGMTLVKFKEVVALALGMTSDASTPLMIASRLSRLARLTLFSGILYTLKDAADRNRLSGTTFVRLNYLSSAAFLSMAGYIMGVGANGWKPKPLGILSLVFSAITAYNGYSKSKQK